MDTYSRCRVPSREHEKIAADISLNENYCAKHRKIFFFVASTYCDLIFLHMVQMNQFVMLKNPWQMEFDDLTYNVEGRIMHVEFVSLLLHKTPLFGEVVWLPGGQEVQ